MISTSKGPQIFLRYGLSRKKDLLKDFNRLYEGLAIPANILLYQYNGTPAVIYRANMPFFIDPMTYLFAHPLDDFKKRIDANSSKFKPSFNKLVLGYGEDPDYLLGADYNSILDYLTNHEDRLIPFINNCFSFQWDNANKTIVESKDLLLTDSEIDLRPSFVIPPYFAYRKETLDLNFKILQHCIDNQSEIKGDIFPMIFLEKIYLTDYNIEKLSEKITSLNFKGYCLWIENFDEKEAQKEEIKQIIKLIKSLSKKGEQIVMLYGGFFSMLLNKFGVTAVSHGIAYSEAKSMLAAVRQTGGGSVIRYYVPNLHQFLTIENSLNVLRKRSDLICDCPVCQRIIQSNPENVTRFNDEEELAEIHFLYNRDKEKKLITRMSMEDIVTYLGYIEVLNNDIQSITKLYKSGSTYQDKPIVNPEYIAEWKNAINESIQE